MSPLLTAISAIIIILVLKSIFSSKKREPFSSSSSSSKTIEWVDDGPKDEWIKQAGPDSPMEPFREVMGPSAYPPIGTFSDVITWFYNPKRHIYKYWIRIKK